VKIFLISLFISIAWCDSVDSEIIKDLDFYKHIELTGVDNEVPPDILEQFFAVPSESKEQVLMDKSLEKRP
jgi:hypothetical protein